ncbi:MULTISPECIES: alpha/beta hydrolase [unclassified Nonomuraea]|uniref:alpha/beta fold hydrolase n=1 Tax=unclassified Nonomuraea TaxID=2593643 RepID=UPI0033D0AEA9
MPSAIPAPVRAALELDGRHLSYLDFGGHGRPLLALHGHLGQGAMWSGLAAELGPHWRVIAPDQRGHGESDRATDYSREGYVADLAALLEHLDVGPVVVLGHSLGGLNAYQLAARHPALVRALVIEEIGAVVSGPSRLDFLLSSPYEAATRDELVAGLGAAGPMFADRLRQLPDGTWRLPFHPHDTVESERSNWGDHWADWLATDVPALLLVGRDSPITSGQAQEMAERRRHTRLVTLQGDHFVHVQDPAGFTGAIQDFLRTLDVTSA